MCKIVKYWFACQHGFRLRTSRCGGTKHKRVRGGLTTACKSESYLNIVFAIDCGPCQHQAFEESWKRKLTLAKMFLETLMEKDMPGVQEVAALVEQLKEESSTASWNSRALFPHSHKERCIRVNLGFFEKAPSPLRHEVLPEDIPEPPEVLHPNHLDYEYDWDYVASTDPIHPVDINYAHPLDDADPSWMLNHLSLEEFVQSSGEIGFDASETDMAWADTHERSGLLSASWNTDADDWIANASISDPIEVGPGQDFEAVTPLSPPAARTKASADEKQMLQERIEMVVYEFWKVVNDQDPCQQSLQQALSSSSDDLFDQLNRMHISNLSGHSDTPHTGLLTPPRTPPHLPTDGSCDEVSKTAGPSPPSERQLSSLTPITQQVMPPIATPPAQSPSPPAPHSTRALYEKSRQHISGTKDTDRIKFSKDLLSPSRCEIKDVEGPDRCFIQDPGLPRDEDAKNG